MIISIIHVFVALFATTLGALSGLGGGVIIKPAYDMMGKFNATEIAVLSTATVFVMSVVSVSLNLFTKKKGSEEGKIDKWIALSMAVGAIGGGYLGNFIFNLITANAVDAIVKIVQNVVLITLIILIIIYMNLGSKPKSLNSKNKILAFFAGVVLGVISSFLGVGGGPMNVAVIMFLFGYSMKSTAICSLIIIIFSQATKLITMTIEQGFGIYNIDILIFVVIAGVCGALIGRFLSKKISEKGVKVCFLCAQIVIVALCIYNIVKYSLAI